MLGGHAAHLYCLSACPARGTTSQTESHQLIRLRNHPSRLCHAHDDAVHTHLTWDVSGRRRGAAWWYQGAVRGCLPAEGRRAESANAAERTTTRPRLPDFCLGSPKAVVFEPCLVLQRGTPTVTNLVGITLQKREKVRQKTFSK